MTSPASRLFLTAGLLSVVAAVQAFAAPAAAPATPDPLDALMTDSPFKPAGTANAAAGQNGPLELRSIVFERGAYFFSLYDQAAKESFWVGLNEPGFPFVARSYDRTNDTLTIEQQGRTLSLTLAASKTATFAGGQQPQQQGMPGAVPGSNGQPGQGPQQPQQGTIAAQNQANGSNLAILPTEEAQRLQRIADEIRRRRNVARPNPVPPPAPPKS